MSATPAVCFPETSVGLILGTAGHIDHGKSSLVQALTGIDPDRLPEEKRRGMTIELGFAHFDLADAGASQTSEEEHQSRHYRIGVVDVPGHERFVRTMVAGATGIDLALLAVAVDDGVMPQTREHVEILNFLGVKHGVIALTKRDLADAVRIDAVRRQVAELLSTAPAAAWPMIPVSVRTKAGLPELKTALAAACRLAEAARRTPHAAGTPFRLAIDRVFVVPGRGTVVTGSALQGAVRAGDMLELLPARSTCRVREVQSHGQTADRAAAGRRTALNLTGLEKNAVERGMELAAPGYLQPSRYLDARIRLSAHLTRPLRSHARVRALLGTREEIAACVMIGEDELAPGEEAFVQLRCRAPVVAAHGQRFILRGETDEATLGGGQVVRPASRRLFPRRLESLRELQEAASDDPLRRADAALREIGFDALTDLQLAGRIGTAPEEAAALRIRLRSAGSLRMLTANREVHRSVIDGLLVRAASYLRRHHERHPSSPGIPADRLAGWLGQRSAASCGPALLELLIEGGTIRVQSCVAALAEFRPAIKPEDAAVLDRAAAEVAAARFDPPAWSELRAVAGLSKQKCAALLELVRSAGHLVEFEPGRLIDRARLGEFTHAVRRLGAGGRRFKLAEVRDALGLTRRQVQPLLEHLDRTQQTRRVGDERLWIAADTAAD